MFCLCSCVYLSFKIIKNITDYYLFVISDSPPFLSLVASGHGRARPTSFPECVPRVRHITLLNNCDLTHFGMSLGFAKIVCYGYDKWRERQYSHCFTPDDKVFVIAT